VTVTPRRTRIDVAQATRDLGEAQVSQAKRIVRVLANLNTYDPASRSLAYPPVEAMRLWDKLAVHPTPTHGSWLNMAEIEPSALGRQ
jgi:hypothetical protein